MNRTIRKTAGNTGLRFHICLNYGSRAEILRAAAQMAQAAAAIQGDGSARQGDGFSVPPEFTEEGFSACLYSAGVPDPDLLIRPGGEKRVSNFLLWQTAYSELVFSDILWPDYSPSDFDEAIEEYRSRKRRFGGRA